MSEQQAPQASAGMFAPPANDAPPQPAIVKATWEVLQAAVTLTDHLLKKKHWTKAERALVAATNRWFQARRTSCASMSGAICEADKEDER